VIPAPPAALPPADESAGAGQAAEFRTVLERFGKSYVHVWALRVLRSAGDRRKTPHRCKCLRDSVTTRRRDMNKQLN